jgi:hypothetical protein
MRTFASLMYFSQSSQWIWLFRGYILGFLTVDFSEVGSSAPRPTPKLEDQVSIFISPGDWVAQLYPQAPSTILVAFYHMHMLQWYYSFPRSPHGEYSALIRSIMTYAYTVWDSAADTYLSKLQRLPNKVLRTTGDCPKSTRHVNCMWISNFHTYPTWLQNYASSKQQLSKITKCKYL